MSFVLRQLVTAISAGALVLAGCAGQPTRSANTSSWQAQMQAGVEALSRDQPAIAVEYFERAIVLARDNLRRPNQLANATWHLADVCFKYSGSCPDGEAWRDTVASYEMFAAYYGPEHPVVIPVLLRLAAIRADAGDSVEAEALLLEADRITARWFPESHFMRARMGDHRPAASLHPRELLQILSELDLLDG